MPNQNQSLRIIRIKTVCEKAGISRATVWAKLNPKDRRHDKTFPRPFRLSDTAKAVGWLEAEIDEWINHRAQSGRI